MPKKSMNIMFVKIKIFIYIFIYLFIISSSTTLRSETFES